MNSKSKVFPTHLKMGILILVLAVLPSVAKGLGTWGLMAHIMTKLLLNVALALGLWIMLQAGELSLGQGAFAAVGAYTTAILAAKYNLLHTIWLTYLVGALFAALLATLVGCITAHLQRIYFMLVTWALLEMMRPILFSFTEPFGGAGGITGIPAPEGILVFGDLQTGFYFVAVLFMAATCLLIWSLSGSKMGLILECIGQNETLVNFCGMYVRRYKVQVFALGCSLTALGGGILASYYTAVSPDMFTFYTSLDIVMFNLIGGVRTLAGPVIGATVLTGVNEALFATGQYKMIAYGLMIVLAMRFLPEGLVSAPALVRTLTVQGPRRR